MGTREIELTPFTSQVPLAKSMMSSVNADQVQIVVFFFFSGSLFHQISNRSTPMKQRLLSKSSPPSALFQCGTSDTRTRNPQTDSTRSGVNVFAHFIISYTGIAQARWKLSPGSKRQRRAEATTSPNDSPCQRIFQLPRRIGRTARTDENHIGI